MAALTAMRLWCLAASPAHLHIHARHDVRSSPADKVIWEERLCLNVIM